MSSRKRKASEQLHEFAEKCGLQAVSTFQVAKGGRRGHAATWRLPGIGADGRIKMVQLDYTFCNARALRLFTRVRNHWFPSFVRWKRERHDHALQASRLQIRILPAAAPPQVRQLKRFYKIDDNVAALRDAFSTAWADLAAQEHGGFPASIDRALHGTMPPVAVQALVDESYSFLTTELGRANTAAHDAATKRDQASRSRKYKDDPRLTELPDMPRFWNGAEWTVSPEMVKILEAQEAARAAAVQVGSKLSDRARKDFARQLKQAAKDASNAWLARNIKQLDTLSSAGDVKGFHAWWAKLEKRGRVYSTGRGRYFNEEGAPPTITLRDEAEGWAAYMAGKYKELILHDAARHADTWEALPDTTDCELPEWVVIAVLKQIKADRAPGEDNTPITLYLAIPEARQVLIKIVQTMWKYELLPAQLPTLIQVMIHKAGRTRSERKNYRPIILQNDLLKLFDGCLYYYMLARETGTIREPVPGRENEGIRPPYLSQT